MIEYRGEGMINLILGSSKDLLEMAIFMLGFEGWMGGIFLFKEEV